VYHSILDKFGRFKNKTKPIAILGRVKLKDCSLFMKIGRSFY